MWENGSVMPQVVSTEDAKVSASLGPFMLYTFKKVFWGDKAVIFID